MNPEKQSRHPDMPRFPEEKLEQNEPKDGDFFIDNALNICLRDIAQNNLEREEPGPEKYCMRRDFIETYKDTFKTQQDFVMAAADELGRYDADRLHNLPNARHQATNEPHPKNVERRTPR